jgi:hypothetical protein
MSAIFTAAAAVYAVGTYKSIEENRKGREATGRAQAASERQYAAESKKAEIQNLRSVRQQIRQARVAQSTMQNVGAQTGGMGSSGMAGGVASVGSQLGSNLGYMSQIASVNTQIGAAAMDFSRSMGEASMASSRANEWSSVAGLGGTVFQAVGGFPKTPTPKSTTS